MELDHQERDPVMEPRRRFPTRIVLAVLTVAAAAAVVVAGLALVNTRPAGVGTGVVVIETNLGLQGGQAAGTGMVLTSSGEVLTNNHVIRGATDIRVNVRARAAAIRPKSSAIPSRMTSPSSRRAASRI